MTVVVYDFAANIMQCLSGRVLSLRLSRGSRPPACLVRMLGMCYLVLECSAAWVCDSSEVLCVVWTPSYYTLHAQRLYPAAAPRKLLLKRTCHHGQPLTRTKRAGWCVRTVPTHTHWHTWCGQSLRQGTNTVCLGETQQSSTSSTSNIFHFGAIRETHVTAIRCDIDAANLGPDLSP